MSRSYRPLLTGVARVVCTGTAAAALLLLAGVSDAAADTRTITGGQVQTFDNSIKGRGHASADAHGESGTGRLEVRAAATAGRPFLGLVGGSSTASATAGVTNTVGVSEGSYTVIFTYDDVAGEPTEAGSGAAASVLIDSVATFTSADETDKTPQPHIAYREVDQDGGDVTVRLEVSVPEAGSLFLIGRVTASADSTRAGKEAEAAATIKRVTVSVTEAG